MQVAAIGLKSSKAATMRLGSICERPNARIPGVSITQPTAPTCAGENSGNATALEEVWRPRPDTSLITPVARSASGTMALIKVDLPTPE